MFVVACYLYFVLDTVFGYQIYLDKSTGIGDNVTVIFLDVYDVMKRLNFFGSWYNKQTLKLETNLDIVA